MLGVLAALYVLLLVAGSMCCAELGQRLGRRRLRSTTPGASLETFVLGLLGLLFAFTFAHAIQRFEDRRLGVVAETNDIGTVNLRLALLPEAAREPARAALRDYVDARLELLEALREQEPTSDRQERMRARAEVLWSVVANAVGDQPNPITALVLPAINDMFDRGAERVVRLRYHPPAIIYGLLFIVTIVASFVTAYRPRNTDRETDWLVRVLFALTVAFTMFVIIDLEHPSHGLFRANELDDDLIALRAQRE